MAASYEMVAHAFMRDKRILIAKVDATTHSATKERYNVDLEALLNVGPGQYVLGLASEQLAKGGLTVRLDTSENTVELVVFGLKPGDYFLECTFKDEPMKIPFRLDNRATVVTLSDIPDRLAETLATSNWTIIDQDNFTIATCNPKIAT